MRSSLPISVDRKDQEMLPLQPKMARVRGRTEELGRRVKSKKELDLPEVIYKESQLYGNESLIQTVLSEVGKLEYEKHASEIRPDTEMTKTREEFPESSELNPGSPLAKLIRQLFEPVLKAGQRKHSGISIGLDFDAPETWTGKVMRFSVNRMRRKDGMRNTGANFG